MERLYFEKHLKIDLLEGAEPIRFVHKRSFDRPDSFQLHLNNYLELYVFSEGEVNYTVGNDCFHLSRGDVLAISPHEVHVPVLCRPCEYERFYLLIPLNSFKNYRMDPLSPLLTRKRALLSLDTKKRSRVLGVLCEISALCDESATDLTRLTALGLLHQLLAMLADEDDNDNATFVPPSGIPELVRHILQYIVCFPREIVSVADIAEHFHISAPYLSALFKKHVGVTVSSYLRIQRIALAKRLLEQGHSVSFVCFECGFSDSSHFIKHFKEFVGVTPHVYKMQKQGAP